MQGIGHAGAIGVVEHRSSCHACCGQRGKGW
jgi:hypothetical protein